MSIEDRSELLPAGFTLDDKYEIVSLIASGGSSDVYKARHRLLDNFVAIKVIHKRLIASENSILRFQREASILNALQHENIVRFLSFGQLEDGRFFMAQELLPGHTLDEILRKEKTLDPARAHNIAMQVCRGLRLAHQNNIVHRDLKPANIAVFENNEGEAAKILDFGIFKSIDQNKDQSLTATGQIIGTYRYASPEQCSNKPISASSDIYSLACVYYEMLCGLPPFADESELAVLNNHVYTNIDKVPSPRPIPNQVQKIILKCLKKKPEERYQNAEELDFALRQVDLQKTRMFGTRSILLLSLILCLAGSATFAILQRNKAEVTAKISEKHKLTYLESRRSKRPEVRGLKNEVAIQMQDEWLNEQAGKWRLEDALDAWCFSAGTRKQLGMRTMPPQGELIEARANKHLTDMFKAHRTNEELLDFLIRYISFLSFSNKHQEAQALLDRVKIQPGHNEELRKKLSCLISMAKTGANLDMESLLTQRLALSSDAPFAKWDDYMALAELAKTKRHWAKCIKSLEKAFESAQSRIERNDDTISKLLCSSLQLCKANFANGKKSAARKALKLFEQSVPKPYQNRLAVYNIEVEGLTNADESDWTPFLKAALNYQGQEYRSAASILAKHASYLGKKQDYEQCLKDLREAKHIYKVNEDKKNKNQQKEESVNSKSKSESKNPEEDKIAWLDRTTVRQVTYGEILKDLALALIMTGKKDAAINNLNEIVKNEKVYQPAEVLSAKDIQICLVHENDPAIMLWKHQELFKESTSNMSFATAQQSLIGHIVDDFDKLKKLDKAREFLLENKEHYWLESTKLIADQLAKTIEKHPDNWREIVINNYKSQSLK